MTDPRKILGQAGEEAAARFLLSKGYILLERNWRHGGGEIDLIVRDGEILVFVEVKTGASQTYGPPEARVDRRKQSQIGRIASAYLAEKNIDMDCRFDVVAVERREGQWLLRHYPDAFWLEDKSDG